MEIHERAVGDVTVLDLMGPLAGGAGALRLKDKVNSLVVQKRTRIVINMGGVAYIDSAGLGEIVSCLTTVSKAGGQLKLLNLTKRNHELLSITHLVTVFETFDSEHGAVRSFGPAGTTVSTDRDAREAERTDAVMADDGGPLQKK